MENILSHLALRRQLLPSLNELTALNLSLNSNLSLCQYPTNFPLYGNQVITNPMNTSPHIQKILMENYLRGLQANQLLTTKLALQGSVPQSIFLVREFTRYISDHYQNQPIETVERVLPRTELSPKLNILSKKIRKVEVEAPKEVPESKNSEEKEKSLSYEQKQISLLKKKKVRRTAVEIVRRFKCMHEGCGKAYG